MSPTRRGGGAAWQWRRRHCDGAQFGASEKTLQLECTREKTSYYQEEVVNGQGPPHELRLAPPPAAAAAAAAARLAAITLTLTSN